MMAKQTQLEWLKEAIESGDSCIEAYEQVDLEQMSKEDPHIADRIYRVLTEVAIINRAAEIE